MFQHQNQPHDSFSEFKSKRGSVLKADHPDKPTQ